MPFFLRFVISSSYYSVLLVASYISRTKNLIKMNINDLQQLVWIFFLFYFMWTWLSTWINWVFLCLSLRLLYHLYRYATESGRKQVGLNHLQEMVYQDFQAVFETTTLPLLNFMRPRRTSYNITNQTTQTSDTNLHVNCNCSNGSCTPERFLSQRTNTQHTVVITMDLKNPPSSDDVQTSPQAQPVLDCNRPGLQVQVLPERREQENPLNSNNVSSAGNQSVSESTQIGQTADGGKSVVNILGQKVNETNKHAKITKTSNIAQESQEFCHVDNQSELDEDPETINDKLKKGVKEQNIVFTRDQLIQSADDFTHSGKAPPSCLSDKEEKSIRVSSSQAEEETECGSEAATPNTHDEGEPSNFTTENHSGKLQEEGDLHASSKKDINLKQERRLYPQGSISMATKHEPHFNPRDCIINMELDTKNLSTQQTPEGCNMKQSDRNQSDITEHERAPPVTAGLAISSTEDPQIEHQFGKVEEVRNLTSMQGTLQSISLPESAGGGHKNTGKEQAMRADSIKIDEKKAHGHFNNNERKLRNSDFWTAKPRDPSHEKMREGHLGPVKKREEGDPRSHKSQ